MGVELKPAIYASMVRMGKADLKPALYASMVRMGKAELRPALYATVVPPSEWSVTVKIDARREVVDNATILAETKREVSAAETVSVDTSRTTGSSAFAIVRTDLFRCIAAGKSVKADTRRLVGGRWNVHRVGTQRITGKNYAVSRMDLECYLEATECISFDTERAAGHIATGSCDTFRLTGWGSLVAIPTFRMAARTELVPADTSIRIPFALLYAAKYSSVSTNFRDLGIRSISMTLGEMTLSDTFQLETVQPMNIDDSVQGQILDYRFHFLVEETSQKDLVQSVKGMYSKDELFYTPINITVDGENASYYADKIALALGLKLDMRCDDFEPSQSYADSGMTYQDFISSLFGWTSKLPQRQINVFIRGDVLHIIQRGREPSVIDITDWPHARPTIERKLVRSIWQRSTSDEDSDSTARSDKDDSPKPFTGIIEFEGISRTYAKGYLMSEKTKDGETTYTYDGEYLIRKETKGDDKTRSVTEYTYGKTERDMYLVEERERTMKANQNQPDWKEWDENSGTERITYHTPVGNGWYGTTVYVDGQFEGSSLTQGKPGGKASQFTIDRSNLSLGAHYSYQFHGGPFTSLIDTEFPVLGVEYLMELTKAIEWLNRKTQETVSLEINANIRDGIPDVTHIVDFTERIRFEGKEYFLMSNAVELTPTSLRQTITMTRWF